MTFDPTSVEVTCVTLPKDHCVQVPWKYIKECGYSDPLKKKQRSLTPRWPLTPSLLTHMCDFTQGLLCPSPMKIYQSMLTQWPFIQKLEPEVIDPRWPLTPRLLRSHVWLYPRIIVSKSHVINFAKLKPRLPHTTNNVIRFSCKKLMWEVAM